MAGVQAQAQGVGESENEGGRFIVKLSVKGDFVTMDNRRRLLTVLASLFNFMNMHDFWVIADIGVTYDYVTGTYNVVVTTVEPVDGWAINAFATLDIDDRDHRHVGRVMLFLPTSTPLDKFVDLMAWVLHYLSHIDVPIHKRAESLTELLLALLSENGGINNYKVEISAASNHNATELMISIVRDYP